MILEENLVPRRERREIEKENSFPEHSRLVERVVFKTFFASLLFFLRNICENYSLLFQGGKKYIIGINYIKLYRKLY